MSDEKNMDNGELSKFGFSDNPQAVLKRQQKKSSDIKALVDQNIAKHGLVKTTGKFEVIIDGKKIEKEYTVFGPKGYDKMISDQFKIIGKSYYGQEMLKGIVSSKDNLYIMYSDGNKGEGRWSTSERILDPYIKNNKDKLAQIISFDSDMKKVPEFTAYSVKNYLDSNNISNNLNITLNPANDAGQRRLLPSMVLAHELYHVWDQTDKAPKGNYFTENYYHQPNKSSHPRQEGNALRYTNQIRMDLGLGYIRGQYTHLLPSRLDHRIDIPERTIERWEKNLPIEYKNLKNKRGMLVKSQWEDQNIKGEGYKVDPEAKGVNVKVKGANGKVAIVTLYDKNDLILKTDAEKETANQFALDRNKENAKKGMEQTPNQTKINQPAQEGHAM